jgi:phospholipid/cholesterol/gamma-HCH transport system substrate-binding protein
VIKTVPTAGRLAIMTVFALSCFCLLLYLWSAFGGPVPLRPKGYRAFVSFPEATQLAPQADIRIAGVSVGKVVKVEPDLKSNRTRATLEIKPEFAPIPKDTRAMLRLKSVLGETFVSLTPGNRRNGLLHDGGTLPNAAVAPTVELDEVLSTFDKRTQAAWQTWMQSQAQAAMGRGADINAAFGILPGFLESSDKLLGTLDTQSAATRKVIDKTGEFFADLSARTGQLRGLITDSNRFFQTTAQRNQDLANVFRELPRFERESRATLPQLTAFGKRSDPVVRQLQPVASAMTPTFAALNRLSPEFKGFFARLTPVVEASQKGLPAFERILKQVPPLFQDFQPFLRDANPMVAYIGAHKREVTSFFANVTAASNGRDVALDRTSQDVHYLRISQTLNPESLSFYPHALGSTRTNAYPAPGAFDKLAAGLNMYDGRTCSNGDVAQPDSADPPELLSFVQQFAFRTSGSAIARPACTQQPNQTGFSTAFPQLRAEP